MTKISELIDIICNNNSCSTIPAQGLPKVPDNLILPDDVTLFYNRIGGAILFKDFNYEIEVVPPEIFVRANSVIVGDECQDDISYNWFIIAKSGDQHITIDLNPNRLGRCYDSFWDRHAVPGDCQIIAFSFTDLLEQLIRSQGGYWYWLRESFRPLGDAYDEE